MENDEWVKPVGTKYHAGNSKIIRGKIWRGMPAHGMDTNAILKNISYSDEQIRTSR